MTCPRRRGRPALAVLLAASTLTVMAGAILAPVLELIRRDLALSESGAGLVLTVHGFSLALVAPVLGRVIDHWGARPTLLCGLAVYGVAGGAGLVIDSYPLLLASRLVFGVGAAAVFTSTTVALFELRRGPSRDRMMGWRSTAISIGGLGWPLVGGLLGSQSWHAPFALYLVGLPLAVACLAALPSARIAADAPVEAPGSSEQAGGLRALVGRRPDLLGFYAVQLSSAVLLYAVLVLLPLRLAELGVTEPLQVASYPAVLSAAMSAVGLGYARLREHWGDAVLMSLSFTLWVLAFGGMGLVHQPALLWASAAIFGLGMGVVVPALTVLVAEAASVSLVGRATAISASATFFGQAVSPLLLGPIVSATSIPVGFAVAATLSGALLLSTRALRRPPTRATRTPPPPNDRVGA